VNDIGSCGRNDWMAGFNCMCLFIDVIGEESDWRIVFVLEVHDYMGLKP